MIIILYYSQESMFTVTVKNVHGVTLSLIVQERKTKRQHEELTTIVKFQNQERK